MRRQDEFITTGDIARLLGCSLDRVTYAMRGAQVAEDARAGNYRLYRKSRLPELIQLVQSVGRAVNRTE